MVEANDESGAVALAGRGASGSLGASAGLTAGAGEASDARTGWAMVAGCASASVVVAERGPATAARDGAST